MIEDANGQNEVHEVPADDSATTLENGSAPSLVYRAVYSTCYCLSFGVAWPTLFVVRALPANGAIRTGLRDGILAAADSSDRVRGTLGHTAAAARQSAENAYAGVAQRVQERIESFQDAVAERRYRRRMGDATA